MIAELSMVSRHVLEDFHTLETIAQKLEVTPAIVTIMEGIHSHKENRMNAFNPASLPVAPEFVDMLREQVHDTLHKCLAKMDAPKEVSDLVGDLESLAYYWKMICVSPESLTGDFPAFDIMDVTIGSINDIAAVGGTFDGKYSVSIPRQGTLLAEKPKAEKVKVGK
jgi:hypothetical protein